jgi:hypothetical protein
MSDLAIELHWDEPDTGCTSCGQTYLTVDDHRCADCIGDRVKVCPHCLTDIEAMIDREVVRRLRAASHDVNDAWTEGKHYAAYRARERVLEARQAARGDA